MDIFIVGRGYKATRGEMIYIFMIFPYLLASSGVTYQEKHGNVDHESFGFTEKDGRSTAGTWRFSSPIHEKLFLHRNWIKQENFTHYEVQDPKLRLNRMLEQKPATIRKFLVIEAAAQKNVCGWTHPPYGACVWNDRVSYSPSCCGRNCWYS